MPVGQSGGLLSLGRLIVSLASTFSARVRLSNVHTKLVILELLAKGIIAGDTEPTTYRMLSYKLHAVLIFELIGDVMKTFGI